MVQVKPMTNLLLSALVALCQWHGTGTEHTITWYWPGEDNWGTAVADPVLMANGPLPESSWAWPLCAVSRDVERLYPMGTWLWVEGIGLRRVSDRTASWVRDVVDIRVDEEYMDRREGVRVWVIFKGGEQWKSEHMHVLYVGVTLSTSRKGRSIAAITHHRG